MIIIGQVRKPEVFEQQYEARINEDIHSNWNIGMGDHILALMSDYNRNFYLLNYGLIPFYSNSKNFIYQAPIHTGNEPIKDHILKKNIIYSKPFRFAIREQRCIIPADYFIIVQKQKAKLFFHQDRSTMALGGIYDFWTNPNNPNDTNTGVAILTLNAYGLFKEQGLNYAPFLIHNRSKRWIRKKAHLNDITSMMQPYEDKLINGYNIKIEHLALNSKLIAQPQSNFFKPRWKMEYSRSRKGESHNRTLSDRPGQWGANSLKNKQ